MGPLKTGLKVLFTFQVNTKVLNSGLPVNGFFWHLQAHSMADSESDSHDLRLPEKKNLVPDEGSLLYLQILAEKRDHPSKEEIVAADRFLWLGETCVHGRARLFEQLPKYFVVLPYVFKVDRVEVV